MYWHVILGVRISAWTLETLEKKLTRNLGERFLGNLSSPSPPFLCHFFRVKLASCIASIIELCYKQVNLGLLFFGNCCVDGLGTAKQHKGGGGAGWSQSPQAWESGWNLALTFSMHSVKPLENFN